MRIGKDLVAAAATPLVLGILAEGESYGYAISKRVTELSGGELDWADGMLYPLLHRLERLGYVDASWGNSPAGRPRKHYRLSAHGETALADHRKQWQVVNSALQRVWSSLRLARPSLWTHAGAVLNRLAAAPKAERRRCAGTLALVAVAG